MPLIWTPQQLDIFDHGEHSRGSLIVNAFAGTGKTSTTCELARRVKGRVFLGAFNKSIADELAERVASNPRCTASTLHSIGFKLWREMRPKAQVDSRKVPSITRERYPFDKKIREFLVDAVGFAKLDGLGLTGMPEYTDEAAWQDLFEQHDMMEEIPAAISYERIVGDCIYVFKRSLGMCESKTECVIDFNDMLYAPLYFGSWKPQRYDWVMIDEAQDTNETRRRLALSLLVDGGAVVAVGDRKQAIYQFAGASHNAMDLIKEATNAAELPLSVTFRCPKKVVAMVSEHVPGYKAAPTNPEGVIDTMTHTAFWNFAHTLTPNDVILCRMTRPLVGVARRLRGQGIACIVEGSNGKAIMALLLKWGEDMTWGQYTTRLDGYISAEAAKLRVKGKDEKAEYLEEKAAILYDIADNPLPNSDLRSVVKRVERMFGQGQDNTDVLRLCTIHRSKGREWDTVVMIGRNHYMPSPWAESEEDQAAEANVEYVGITRTMKRYVDVDVPEKPKKGKGGGGGDVQEWWEL